MHRTTKGGREPWRDGKERARFIIKLPIVRILPVAIPESDVLSGSVHLNPTDIGHALSGWGSRRGTATNKRHVPEAVSVIIGVYAGTH